MAISELSSHLTPDEYGIWRTDAADTDIAYPETGNAKCFQLEDNSFWFQHRNACIVALVKRFRPDGPLLDVGGGNGFVSQGLISDGIDTILLEPGPLGALNAKTHRGIPDVICATIQDARFESSSIAAVGLFDVLEHLVDDTGIVSDLQRVLKPGGFFFGTVPAHQWMWSTADDAAHHQRRYNHKSLSALMSKDYEMVYSTYFFQALTFPIFALRALPYRLGIGTDDGVLDAEAEHGADGGISTRVLSGLLAAELHRVNCGATQRWGASLLFAARKRSSR